MRGELSRVIPGPGAQNKVFKEMTIERGAYLRETRGKPRLQPHCNQQLAENEMQLDPLSATNMWVHNCGDCKFVSFN